MRELVKSWKGAVELQSGQFEEAQLVALLARIDCIEIEGFIYKLPIHCVYFVFFYTLVVRFSQLVHKGLVQCY